MRQGKQALTRRLVALAAVAVGVVFVPSASAWTVNLTAEPELKRTHSWTIAKSVSQSALTLAPGESATVTYSVAVSHAGSTDSDWAVKGVGTSSADASVNIATVDVKILPEEFVASTTCTPAPPTNLAGGLVCNYSASLPDASPRTAWMRMSDGGGNFRNEFAPFDFSSATVNNVDECVAVTDTIAGPLGSLCVADAPKTYTYTTTVGPFTEEECGEHVINNTASFLTNDTGASGSASASVVATVVCAPPSGCTRTIGYWKTHAGFGPQADVVSPLLPIWLGTAGGAKSINVTTAAKAVSLLKMEGSNGVKAASNGINKLYAQLLGAKLNAASGASTSGVSATMAAADAFLANNNSLSWSGLSSTQKATVNGWMTKLDTYNNGDLGTAHCDD